MSTVSRAKRWTYADLAELPDNDDGNRYEIIDGELIVSPSAIPPHQALSRELMLRFALFVQPGRLGQVFAAPIDVLLPDGGTLVPDLVFVRRDRLGIVGRAAIEAAPDIVVEILSPSTRGRDLGRKKELYAQLGVPEYWVVDRDTCRIAVFVLRDGRYEPLPNEDGVARSEVLPGFEVDIAALFAAAEF